MNICRVQSSWTAWDKKKLILLLHRWDREGKVRKDKKEQSRCATFNLKWCCWNITPNSESPRPFSLLSLLGTEIVERSFDGNHGKHRHSCLYPHGREQRGHLWDHTQVHQERVDSQDFYRVSLWRNLKTSRGLKTFRKTLEICRHLVDCHRISYLRL